MLSRLLSLPKRASDWLFGLFEIHDMPEPSASDMDRLWEWVFHDNIVFGNRTNLFLIAQSILLAGCFALATADRPHQGLLTVLASAGILFDVLWLYVASHHMAFYMRPMLRLLYKYSILYRKIKERSAGWPAAHAVVGIVLPVFSAALWVYLLVTFRS